MDTLETKTCGRCGGSGKHSWNAIHRDRCYGCGGTGKVYTRRGKMAKVFLDKMRSVNVEDLQVGDLLWVEGLNSAGFRRVTEVKQGPKLGKPDEVQVTVVAGEYSIQMWPGYKVRKGWSAEDKAEHLRLALAYQASLTKDGKLRRRACATT